MLVRSLLIVLLTFLPLAAGDSSFDGKWRLDQNASVSSPLESLEQRVKLDGNAVEVKSTWREPRGGVTPVLLLGVMANDLKLTTDGSENHNFFGPYHHVSKTTVEGNRMVTQWVAQMKDSPAQVTGEWIRTVSDDGRTMTLEIRTSRTDGQNNEVTLVFKK